MDDVKQSAIANCPQCGGDVDVRTPHVIIDGTRIRAFCSEACATTAQLEPIAEEPVAPQRRWTSYVARLGAGLPFLAFTSGYDPPTPPEVKPIAAEVVQLAEPEPPTFGPSWPPSAEDWADEIANDAWIHPLDGPQRRMPMVDSRVFGAERPGERPGECNNGHCGVDLPGPWGEPVHAAHDGVVDRVQRGPNEEHGGIYVKLAHRDGTIFTSYFHLAAVPRRLEPGVRVRAGEVIGLLGDTGVKKSAPHLHFTISVKAAGVNEKYIDPEPLVALWPLRIPVGEEGAMVDAQAAPGVPLGAAPKRRHKPRLARAPEPVAELPAVVVE